MRRNAAADLFNEAAKLHRQGNVAMADLTDPDRRTGRARWTAAIAAYQRCLEVEPSFDDARTALLGLLEWQEADAGRSAAMCREIAEDLAGEAADWALATCRSLVDELAHLATCRSSHVVVSAWLFKESSERGIGGASSFRRYHCSVEKKMLYFYRDFDHDDRKDRLNLGDVVHLTVDFPRVDARAWPPAYCRFELVTHERNWLLAVPPEDIALKRDWIEAVAARAGLAVPPPPTRALPPRAPRPAPDDEAGE